jgi:hypothetical protein
MLKTIFQSSLDPSKVSLTIQSFSKTVIFIVGFFALQKGFDPATATTQIQGITDIVISLIPAVLAVYHGGETIYGMVRKMFVVKTA